VEAAGAAQPGARAAEESVAGSKASHANPASDLLLALASALWERAHVLPERTGGLASLLDASLRWDTARLTKIWEEMLGSYGDGLILSLKMRLAGHETLEDEKPWSKRRSRWSANPEAAPWTAAKIFGEIKHAIQVWYSALDFLAEPIAKAQRHMEIALYEIAVSRFGIREEFLKWRPRINDLEWWPRKNRPEWQIRVQTVDGRWLAKLLDGTIVAAKV